VNTDTRQANVQSYKSWTAFSVDRYSFGAKRISRLWNIYFMRLTYKLINGILENLAHGTKFP